MKNIKNNINVFTNNKIIIKNNNIFEILRFLTKIKCDIRGKNNKIIIKSKIKNLSKLFIQMIGDNNIIFIASQCIFYENVRLRTDMGGQILIKSGTSINSGTIHALENSKVIIGRNCMISDEIDIRSSDGHWIYKENNKHNRINNPSDVYIGNHVWIGKRVQCLKNTQIPDNCVIGANSLITKKFDESNVVIAGHPAKIINRGINWKK